MSLRQHRLLIYRLKRTFGQKIKYLVPTQNDHDILTGAITRAFTQFDIKRAVVMPAELMRSFVYDLAFIASAKNFTHGGYFDATNRWILVSAKDFPKGFKPKIKHHLEFDDEKWEIKTILIQPPRAFYAIAVQSLSNAVTVGR